MNDYQFDFIARALLAILNAVITIASQPDPDHNHWTDYNELEDQHENWKKEHPNDNVSTS